MSRVDELLQEFISQHRTGAEPDPISHLREVSGAERDELAALIDHYLAQAPSSEFKPAEFERFRDSSRWQAVADRVLWPTLEELRADAEMSKREIAAALARDLDVVGHENAVKARYHELETGQLDAELIAARVWNALGRLFEQPVDRIREIVDGSRQADTAGIAFARGNLEPTADFHASVKRMDEAKDADPVDAAFFSNELRSVCQILSRDCALVVMARNDLTISKHAASRFHARVRPTLDPQGARKELERLVALGTFVNEPPRWFAERQREVAPRYLVVGDLVLPLRPTGEAGSERWCAVTCIARGGISEKARRVRNRRRRSEVQRQHTRRVYA